MVRSKREKELEQLELEANYEKKKIKPSYSKLIKKFEELGDKWFDIAGVDAFNRAEKNYENAKIYAQRINSEVDIERIQKQLDKLKKERKKLVSLFGLEKKLYVFAILSIISLISALFFISYNFTGYTVLGISQDNSHRIGLCLFICGLTFTFLYLRGRKRF